MAPKRTGRGTNQRETLKVVRTLTKTAKAELKQLLRRYQTGNITRMELNTGLNELTETLKEIEIHEHFLD